jgi:hypothetical protein
MEANARPARQVGDDEGRDDGGNRLDPRLGKSLALAVLHGQ